jgi:hypothetical protein
MTPMQVSVEEVQMLLGQKDIEIFALHKQIVALQKRVEELTPKPEPKA